MDSNTANAEFQVITFALFFANTIVYFIFNGIGSFWNKIAKREIVSKRIFGCIGVILFTVVGMWYARTHLVGQKILDTLPPYRQGEVVGQVMGVVIFPAVVVLAIVGIRAWLAKRKGAMK
jgi:hypothetical protein